MASLALNESLKVESENCKYTAKTITSKYT